MSRKVLLASGSCCQFFGWSCSSESRFRQQDASCPLRADLTGKERLLKQKEGETGNAVSFIIRGKISNFGPRLSPALEQTSHVFCWWLRHITVLAGCPCWLTEGGLAVAE